MSTPARSVATISAREYLAFERAAEAKHEYVYGEVLAMSGARWAHVAIVANLSLRLNMALRSRGCWTVTNDLRVTVPPAQAYVYPDVVVVCGEPLLEDEHGDTLLNPTAIIEVLSTSTADYDHGRKWELYRRLRSLQDYLLVAQDEPRIERYTRHDDAWLFSETTGLDAELHLESLGCSLALKDVYEGVLDSAPAVRIDPNLSDHG